MKSLIENFYTAFNNKDAASMVACYHDDVIFNDPVFGELKGNDANAMWAMLCGNAKDLKIEISNISASLKKGFVHWEAWYTFSRTGRKVHNIVDAQFEFKESKIIRHADNYDVHKWASQAMGWKGKLFGGMTFFQNKLRKQAKKTLNDFIKNNKP